MDTTEPLAALVRAAREGRQDAWDAIVDRFVPLVGAIIRRHRLSEADGDDVSQTVWLRLVEHLGALREPDALPGWIRTTTRNECLRVLAARGRVQTVDPQVGGGSPDGADAAVPWTTSCSRPSAGRPCAKRSPSSPPRAATCCCSCSRTHRWATRAISSRLGIPIGSIGPTRARALEQLRRTRALRGLRDMGPDPVGGVV